MKKINLSTLSLLLVLAFSQPARAAGWDWESLKKAAVQKALEVQKEAEKKVDEWVDLAKTKWAEWNGTPQAQKRQIASQEKSVPAAPKILPAQGETVNITNREEKETFKKIIEASKQAVGNKAPIQIAEPGRAPQKDIPLSKAGVPKFALSRTETKTNKDGTTRKITIQVEHVPRLDVGLERKISKNDLVSSDLLVGFKPIEKAKSLPSPKTMTLAELEKVKKTKILTVAKWAGPNREKHGIGEIVTQEKVDNVNINMNAVKPMDGEKPLSKVTVHDLKMLSALQVNKKGDRCHIVSGLFHDLAREKEYQEEASFHLGVCAHQMGLNSEAVKRLLQVVRSEHPDYAPDAITNLVENLPREYDLQVASAIKAVKNKSLIPDKAKDHMHYVLARAAHRRSAYNEAIASAEQVSAKSPLYGNARYLYAIALYGAKKNRAAQNVLTDLRKWMSANGKSDRNLEALITVNLARMMFVEKRYQLAQEEYRRVPKDHPLWVPGLVEQGWTQLNTDDAPGAIGNMYSLHSPYFKSVFMPDSWIVRTIGYIDICQYGDAYRTLTKLEELHKGHLVSVEEYSTKFKKADQYYTTVRNYIRGRSDQAVDGLPAQVIREIARQRAFLNAQTSLNEKEDEIVQYSFIQEVIAKDRGQLQAKISQLKGRIAALTENLKKAEKDPALAKNINEWEAQRRNETATLRNYEFQLTIYDDGRQGYNSLKKDALARVNVEKSRLRMDAGTALMGHLKELKTRLARTLESNEFLRYEIFAGSGENIRYQVAGGATAPGQRIPASVKPQKILNWQFDGEYWEDEIGSYRSTLRNNCPKNPRAQASAGQ